VAGLSAAVLSGTLLAVNALAYVFTVLAARTLAPAAYGELAALLGVLLVGTVPAGGLQTHAALQLGSGRARPEQVARQVHTAGIVLAVGVGAAALLAGLPLAALLHLDGPGSAALLAGQLVPYTVLGGYSGILQGTGRYARLALVTAVHGVTRLVGGVVGLLVGGTPTSALTGLAIGAVVGAVAAWTVAGRPGVGSLRSAPVVPALRASGALLGFVLLTNLDLLLARHHLSAAAAGQYAVGSIVVKVVFWLPQGIAVVLLPRLADPDGRARVLPRGLAVVAGLGAVLTVGATALGVQALRLLGGPAYGAQLGGAVGLFAGLGTLLAVAQLLLFSAIAARAAAPVTAVWLAVAGEVVAVTVLARTGDPGVVGIVGCAVATAALLVGFGLLQLRADLRSAGPDRPGLRRDVLRR
jgi:O-antigen/teichoic acid export membrane protein